MSEQYHSQSLQAYNNTQQSTLQKTRQVVLLYEGAIEKIELACKAINDGAIEQRYNLLEKATKIILALQLSLDFEKGGELSQTLDNFYKGIYMRLHQVQRTNDLALAKSLCEELRSMQGAWEGVDAYAKDNISDEEATVNRNLALSI